MDRRARRVAGAFASGLLLTACGPRFDQGTLEASNGTLTPVRSSAPAPTTGAASGVSAVPGPGGAAEPTVAEGGSGGAGVAPVRSGSEPAAQRGSAVAQAGGKPSAASQASAAGSAGQAGPSTAERSPGQTSPSPATGAAPPVAPGLKSEVVLGSIGVEAGLLGAVSGPAPPAIRAWAAYVNARGGLAGHRVRVILADDGNDPARAQALVRQLVEREKVVAFINEYTLNTLGAVMPYLEEKKIPVIGSIGGDLIGGSSPMMFNPLAGSFGESHAWATLLTINAMTEKKKLGLVYCREVNGCTTYVQTIKKLMPYGDLNIVYEAQVSLAQPDYTAEMLEAQRAGAEVLFTLVDSASIGRVAKSAHRQGYQPIFVAAFNASHDLVFAGGKDVEGLLVGGRYAPWDSSPLVEEYREAMKTYQPNAPRGDLGGGVFVVGRLLQERIALFLKEPPTSAQFLEGLYALDKDTLGGRLPGISFPHGSHAKVNLCTVPQRLVNGRFTTRDAAASFVCAPGWAPAARD
jgi:branched-chain amino acid transport system substrate-binding protein